MKSIIMPVPEQLNEEAKDLLFGEVTEIVVKTTLVTNKNRKRFTAQEMWNRQRQAKSASSMMRRWNLS